MNNVNSFGKTALFNFQKPITDITECIEQSSMSSPMKKYQILESLRQIVHDIRKGVIPFSPDELVPKMLEVGRARGTADFERAVTDLLATLAKKIPSTEYRKEFEKYI